MANYLIRVQLHGPAADPAALDAAMHKGGAEPVIPGTDDSRWHLPSGTYVVQGLPGGANALRDVVRQAAKAAHSDPEAYVLVVEFTDAAWYGKEVDAL